MPEGAGRDRRPADPLARDPDLRGAGVRALPARDRLHGRGGRGVRARRERWPDGVRGRVRRHRARHADRGADRARSASGSAAGTSAPPTPTASPTSTSARCSTSTASSGALATVTVVRPAPAVGRRRARQRTTGRRASSRSRAASTGSTAASSASSRGVSTTSTTTACSSASRWSGLPPTAQLRAFRHEGFWDCMDTYKDAVVLNDLWASGEAPWRMLGRRHGSQPAAMSAERRSSPAAMASSPRTWRGRCSSGATRCACSTGRTRASPTSAAGALGLDLLGSRRGRAGRGRPARRRGGRRGGRRLRLASSTSPRRRSSGRPGGSPLETLRSQRARRLERASRPAASTASRAVVVASSDKAYGASPELPYREDLPLRAAYPYDASKAAADIDRPQLSPRLRRAARGHPLRQHLRRRRPQLLAPDPGGGRSPCSTAARR